ncbi:MAG TPA: apolipoprotein N-acyltransferase [Nocardioidaceae bacterium]|nr:apolipoprotein N-acyltransferase [Nocardioidaceae bacterium]
MAWVSGRSVIALRCAGAAGSGAAAGLAFAPHHLLALMPVGVAGLTWACFGASRRLGAGAGALFGFTFMLVLVPWLRVVGTDAWIAVAALQAVFFALLGLGLAGVTRLPGWPLWAACLWVALELARSRVPFGGFPWGRLAFATVDWPVAAYSRVGGTAAVTAVLVLASNLALWAVLNLARRRRFSKGNPALAVGASLAALAVAVGAVLGGSLVSLSASPSGHTVVALVQGNVPQGGLRAYSQARAVLDNHADATAALARAVAAGRQRAPNLVIWPESSTDIDPFADGSAARQISSAVGAIGAPTLVGAVISERRTGARQNIGVVWDPVDGPGQRYVKRHAVPFGEYIPLRGVLAPFIDRLDQIAQDQASGSTPGILHMAGVRVGDVICFEVAYDGLVRDVVTAGAELVVVQTNNATYLDTGQLEQQWDISRLQAIQTGRVVAVAATNGISGFAAPDGRALAQAQPGTRALLVRRVALYEQTSLGVRLGEPLEGLLALLGLGAAVIGGVRRR